jgi:hypothetical protein
MQFFIVFLLGLGLSGCGAAGAKKLADNLSERGSGTSPTAAASPTTESNASPTTESNNAPVFANDPEILVRENTQTVAIIRATDQESDDVTLSIVGGADRNLFTLSSAGELSFASSPDYEIPNDADSDNEYAVEIRADDGEGQTSRTFLVSVINLLEGYVVDGPLKNSTVFLDLNGDLLKSDGEPESTTDGSGYFELEEDTQSCTVGVCDLRVVSIGGTDISTNENVTLSIYGKALGGADFSVTPVSTLMAESLD